MVGYLVSLENARRPPKAEMASVNGLVLKGVIMLRRFMWGFRRGREKRLIRAAEDGELEVVTNLLKVGVNPNATSYGDVSVLMWAAARGHLDVVKELLAFGADSGAQTRKGKTASEIAIQEGHDDIATFLQE
jgi:hypothetical protein